MNSRSLVVPGLLALLAYGAQAQVPVRIGAFPNITHPQAMIGKANHWFVNAMGSEVRIEWKSFNAGPAAIEALLAGALDLTYVGPNPAINGYLRSNGKALKVVAGATSGGAALVVRRDAGIAKAEDFHGKKVASPQLGNTQDVALRAWLRGYGLKTRDKGGDVEIIPVPNADQLALFLRKDLDAAWAPEPWATRLIREANGRLFLDERSLWPNGQFVTALLIVRTEFLERHPDLVKSWLRAHVELTAWIGQHPADAKRLLNQQIQAETGKALSPDVIEDSFSRLEVTFDPLRASLLQQAKSAFDSGFLGREMPDLSGLFAGDLLNQVLADKGKGPVQ